MHISTTKTNDNDWLQDMINGVRAEIKAENTEKKEVFLKSASVVALGISRGGIKDKTLIIAHIRDMLHKAWAHDVGIDELIQVITCYGHSGSGHYTFCQSLRHLRDLLTSERKWAMAAVSS